MIIMMWILLVSLILIVGGFLYTALTEIRLRRRS